MTPPSRTVEFPLSVIKGIGLINSGLFFEAHEILENEWKKETRSIRRLYQGLIQFSAACLHLQRGNRYVSKKLLAKSATNLSSFLDAPLEIDLKRLIKEMEFLNLFINQVSFIENQASVEINYPKINGIKSINPGSGLPELALHQHFPVLAASKIM
ncbi:MAG: hypothetical protein FD147_205 [Chloroflexi bacterium]|nr:MAG: hypothetical protein FD147_205 [Chloroflexota bacterium]